MFPAARLPAAAPIGPIERTLEQFNSQFRTHFFWTAAISFEADAERAMSGRTDVNSFIANIIRTANPEQLETLSAFIANNPDQNILHEIILLAYRHPLIGEAVQTLNAGQNTLLYPDQNHPVLAIILNAIIEKENEHARRFFLMR